MKKCYVYIIHFIQFTDVPSVFLWHKLDINVAMFEIHDVVTFGVSTVTSKKKVKSIERDNTE